MVAITRQLALAAALWLAAAPAAAQRDAVQEGDPAAQATNLPEVTTVSPALVEAGEPLWWVVYPPGARMPPRAYILGVPWAFIDDGAWRQGDIRRALEAADTLVLPPVTVADPDGPSIFTAEMTGVGPVPPDLYGPLGRAATIAGQPSTRYLQFNAYQAGYLLVSDFRRGLDFAQANVTQEIVELSQEIDSPGRLRYAAGLRLPGAQDQVDGITDLEARRCLEAAIEEVLAGEAGAREATLAWRNGDLDTALAGSRALEFCTYSGPAMIELRNEANARLAAAVVEPPGVERYGSAAGPTSRNRPTRMVAVAYLRSLVSEDGVLDHLRSMGYRIEGPMQLPDVLFRAP